MNPESESESIITSAQKHFKEKLEKLSNLIRNSSEDFQNDPLLLSLKQDPVTEAYVPLRLKELYEDKMTKELIEGLKKELSQTITEYFFEMNSRLNAEKKLEQERQEKKESIEESGILKLSIKELESNLENLRVKYETGMKSKQSEILERKDESNKRKKVVEELEKVSNAKNDEIQDLKSEITKEKNEKSRLEESLSLLKRENEGNKRKLDILEEEHYNLNIKFKDSAREIEFLNSQIFKINSEKHELEESTSFFKMTLESEKEKELSECKSQAKDLKKKFSERLEEVKEEIDKKNSEVEGLKHKVSELEHCLSISQQRFQEDKNDLTQALEISKCDYEESISNILKQNEFESRNLRKKHENEIDDQKNYYKNIIKSQMDEFEARAAGFYQREKEKDEQYSSLLKDLNESYIEKKTHSVVLTEQLEQAKNVFQRTLKTAENELNSKWEKELKNLVHEKNSKIDEIKSKLEESFIGCEKTSRKLAKVETLLEIEKSKNEEILSKNENLKKNLLDLHQTRANFSEQLAQVNKLVNELKTQLSDIQTQKAHLEDQNLSLEQQITLIEKVNQESSNIVNKRNLELQSESFKLNEQIEDLQNEIARLKTELLRKQETYKILEKRFNDFKTSAKETADKFFNEVSAEKDLSRNQQQKTLQELELTRLELEMLQKKHQKAIQELQIVQNQASLLKEQFFSESSLTDSLKLKVLDYETEIQDLERFNEELRSEVLRKNKEFFLIFKEIFNKTSSELAEVKKQFIDEIKELNSQTFVMFSDMSNSILRVFNSSKLAWLKEKEELNRELMTCKYESNKLRELLKETEENHYQDQTKLKKVLQTLQSELTAKEDEVLSTTASLQEIETEQDSLKALLKEREAELLQVKQHFDQTLSESELIFTESQQMTSFYKSCFSDLLRNFSGLEETHLQSLDTLQAEVVTLKSSLKQEIEDLQKKHFETVNYKDALLTSKDKNAEYYRDLCNSLEKDAKRAESQFLGKISDLESQLKQSSFRFSSFEPLKAKRLNE
jgi:chromosome segregation ATPase